MHIDPFQILEIEFDTFATSKKNLNRNIIVLNSMFKSVKCGIAAESVVKSYYDFEGIDFNLNRIENSILHSSVFLPEKSIEINYAFQVISILNQISNSNFSIFIHETLIDLFKKYCNDHITVLPFNENEPQIINTNLLITYGSSVIHFLRNKLPVFVLGPNGLGGLVTPVNLPFLYKTDFMGRPGGSYNENIPIEIVAHELGIFKDMKDIGSLLEENKVIADAFPVNPLSKEIPIQTQLQSQWQALYGNVEKRNTLKPKLCSNMNIVFSDDNAIIKRRYLNDTLCVVDKDDATFFKALNGIKTCRDLQNEFNLCEEEFWSMTEALLEKQIIVLNL